MEEIKSLFFRMFRIADMKEPFEELHYHLLEKLSHINAPFGLMGVDLNSLKMRITNNKNHMLDTNILVHHE